MRKIIKKKKNGVHRGREKKKKKKINKNKKREMWKKLIIINGIENSCVKSSHVENPGVRAGLSVSI